MVDQIDYVTNVCDLVTADIASMVGARGRGAHEQVAYHENNVGYVYAGIAVRVAQHVCVFLYPHINPASSTVRWDISARIACIDARRITEKVKVYGVSKERVSWDIEKAVTRRGIRIGTPGGIAYTWATRKITINVVPGISLKPAILHAMSLGQAWKTKLDNPT